MRKLASIQRIKALEPIDNADAIEKATVLGWQLVVKKGEFKVGELCVYVEIDSIMPDKTEFEFLKARGMRIKTIRLRGQISQGICFPLSILPPDFSYDEDTDCTDVLSITKHEPAPPKFLSNKPATRIIFPKWMPAFVRGFLKNNFPKFCERFRKELNAKTFPPFLIKTDETRVQVLQPLLDKYLGTKCFITEKLDGSSVTFYYKDGQFGVCSRNLELPYDESNGFWKAAIMLGIEDKLKSLRGNYALQGELVGEGIQGNKLNITGTKVYFFNAFDINQQKYLGYDDFKVVMDKLGLPAAPVLLTPFWLENDIEKLVKIATGKSVINPNIQREGIVIRPIEEMQDFSFSNIVAGRVSFKVINPEFLIKYGE